MSNENLTEKTLADVQAGIPARDAEIESLRKENAELREQLENFGNDTKMVAGCCGRSECGGECGNDWVGMVPAQQPVSGADVAPKSVADALELMDAILAPECGLLAVPYTSATVTAAREDLALIRAALAQQDAETGKTVSVENQGVTQREADKEKS